MLRRAVLTIAALMMVGAAFLPSRASATTFVGPIATLSKTVVTPPEQARWYRVYRRYYWRPRYRYYRRHYYRPYYRYRRYYRCRYYRFWRYGRRWILRRCWR